MTDEKPIDNVESSINEGDEREEEDVEVENTENESDISVEDNNTEIHPDDEDNEESSDEKKLEIHLYQNENSTSNEANTTNAAHSISSKSLTGALESIHTGNVNATASHVELFKKLETVKEIK